MRRALPIQIALIALFLTACSTGTPPTGGALDGPMTTITLATADGGASTAGVPFVGNQPVVTAVSVAITAVAFPNPPVELRFSLVDGVFTYDPEGDLTSLDFAFTDNVTVTLPADMNYSFATRGVDVATTWIAYGVTNEFVQVSTESVPLALKTLIDDATLDVEAFLGAIAANQTIDLFLRVTAPGGDGAYDVPTSDYEVEYEVLAVDGNLVASSKLGAQVRAHATPTENYFNVTATVTGWRNVNEEPVFVEAIDGIVATFEVAFTNPTGLGFDTAAPDVSLVAPLTGNVASSLALSGTATDAGGLARVQVFVGPVLIASTDGSEVNEDVDLLAFDGTGWTYAWTPTEVRTHTFTVLAVDTAGNERRASATVDVEAALPPTVIVFDQNVIGLATVAAGESVVLSGATFTGFNPNNMSIYLLGDGPSTSIPWTVVGFEDADGTWSFPWTAPSASGNYNLEYYYDDPMGGMLFFAYVELRVQ